MRFGYCAVGGPILGAEQGESLRAEGFAALQTIDMESVGYPTLVADGQDCAAAARFFHQEKVDAVVVNFAGWLGGGDLLRLAAELNDVPLVLWGFGRGPTLTLTCLIECTSDFTKTGKRFLTAIGDSDDPKTLGDIAETLRAIDVYKAIARANVGLIGYACPGMLDVTVDEMSLRRKIGCDLVHLDLFELMQEYNNLDEAAAIDLARGLADGPGKVNVAAKELAESTRLYLAMRRIAERYDLDAIAIRCWPELRDVPPSLHVTPCYGMSRLGDEGIVAACEADVSAAVTMFLLRRLTGAAPAVLDYNTVDRARNSLGLWHCGPHALSLAQSPDDLRLGVPPIGGSEEWGGGCAMELSIKEGPATFAKLTREYDRMSIASGTFVRPDRGAMRGGIGEAVMSTDVHSYLHQIIREGFEHHVCAVHGDVKGELQKFCTLADIRSLVF